VKLEFKFITKILLIENNIWYEIIIKINHTLTRQRKCFDGLSENLTVSDMVCFKYALLISIDIKRSFSRYKNLLALKYLRAFKFENLKQTLIVQCNEI